MIMGNAGGTMVNPMIRNAGIIRMEPTTIIEARRPTLSTIWPNTGANIIEANMMIVVVPPAVVNIWKML